MFIHHNELAFKNNSCVFIMRTTDLTYFYHANNWTNSFLSCELLNLQIFIMRTTELTDCAFPSVGVNDVNKMRIVIVQTILWAFVLKSNRGRIEAYINMISCTLKAIVAQIVLTETNQYNIFLLNCVLIIVLTRQ